MDTTLQSFNTLTSSQQEVFVQIEQGFDNYMVLGEPGVGKSVLINALATHGNKSYTLAAPTGLAAVNINGRTLHSLFMLPQSEGMITDRFSIPNLSDRHLAFLQYGLRVLIIDEISMVRADTLDYIDRLLRTVRGTQKAFGGVQIVAFGDFYQLPPITRAKELKELHNAGYDSPFAFSAKVFESFQVIHLNKILRQTDPEFLEILGEARNGRVSHMSTAILNEQVGVPKDFVIQLTGINKQADETNQTMLAAIPAEPKTFAAEFSGTWPAYPCDPRLVLKVGAQVMVKMNNADADGIIPGITVNGTIGKVHAFHPNNEYIEVALQQGQVVKIRQKEWTRKVKKEVDGEQKEVVVATFKQFPLSLAWAISIHKSQGQTFDRVYINPSRIFAPGQLYVALSRCRSLEGIVLSEKIFPKKFFTDRSVTEFYRTFAEQLNA